MYFEIDSLILKRAQEASFIDLRTGAELSDRLFGETCGDVITVVEPNEDKGVDKFFQILLRHAFFNS